MDWTLLPFIVAFVTWLLWAFTASYAASTLQSYWPEIYAKLGSPKPRQIWFSRSLGTPFDSATMFRRFRNMGIANRDILFQLELTCWLRWVFLISVVTSIAGVFLLVGGHRAP